MTRQNCIPNHDAKITNALIPLWDMCNHSNGKITTGFNKGTNKCECLALKNFKKGDQIFIFYGARTNAEFLLHNGFVYAENEYDSYRLRLGLSKADALYELRASVLSRLNLPPSGDFYLRRSSEPVDGELLAFLRVFNMEEGDLKHWLESSSANNLKSRECILDLRIENKAWNYLAARINLLLISYANITENCNGNLEVSDARRMIRLQKKLEKNILTETLSYVQQHLKN